MISSDNSVLQNMAVHELNALRTVLLQLTAEEYTKELPLLEYMSIGKHVRHTLEFHQCLYNDVACVSYDKRNRNLELEVDLITAMHEIDQLISAIRSNTEDKNLVLEVMYANESVLTSTTLYREITFLIEHTVHHLAILRIALTSYFKHIQFSSHFGYADSTLRFKESQRIAI